MPAALSALPYALGFLLPPLVWWSAHQGSAWVWLPLVVLYVGIPVVDALAGLNQTAPTAEQITSLERNPWFRLVTWTWVPVQVWLVIWAVDTAVMPAQSPGAWVALLFAVGSIHGAIGITYAHELVHRSRRVERLLGDVLLATVSYPHFAVEHVYGHHRHVATPADPATAQLGEGFYHFWPRTVWGGMRHAWTIRPRTVSRYIGTMAAVYAAVLWHWGAEGLVFFVLQGVLAFTLLEAINYVEHYGLQRRELAPGRYERVGPAHSWDSSHRISNWLLINLARHADHHLTASRRYQALASQEQAPQLPAGYATMVLLAFVPPLWRKVMDPRVVTCRSSAPAPARTPGSSDPQRPSQSR